MCGRTEQEFFPAGFSVSASSFVSVSKDTIQATFPWNFAAWNNDRTLCILSFHGDAPRTNLCGYGAANMEWGRTRNIDGIPALMVEGEYEWWQARVRPAQAFQLMYPGACVSFLCDAGSGHFDLCEATIDYMALFIQKAFEQRLNADGTLKRLDPADGWRYGIPQGGETEGANITAFPSVPPAPWAAYAGDPHEGDTLSLEPGWEYLYISGPVRKLSDRTFLYIPYDCGTDNPKRSHNAWIAAVKPRTATHEQVVQPLRMLLP